MAHYANKDSTLSGAAHGAVAYFKSISWDGPSIGSIDVTDSSSTNQWREFIGGLKQAGNLTLTLQYNATLWDSLITALGMSDTWTLTLPDTSTLICTGFLMQGPGGGGDLESGIDTDVTIQLSGQPAFSKVA